MSLLPGDGAVGRAGLVGAAVGVVLAAALVVTGVLARDEHRSGDEAAEELVAAWQRHRSGTFVVESEWRRTMRSSGSTLRSATRLAQRPPDRVLRQFGAVRGQLNGSPVRCSSDPVGGYRCFASEASVPDYASQVDEEVQALRTSVMGPDRVYAVTTDGDGCFDLEQVSSYPDPQYGRRGELCFDQETGALRYLRRELDRAVEEQEAILIRGQVTDADFDVSADPAYDLVGDGPIGEVPGSGDPVAGPGGPDTTDGGAAGGSVADTATTTGG